MILSAADLAAGWGGWIVVVLVALAVIAALAWCIWIEQADQHIDRLNRERQADYERQQEQDHHPGQDEGKEDEQS